MAEVDDWVVPKDDWVVPGASSRSVAPSGAQGSLYDPKNPVLSDDPRYWPPQALSEERGTLVPLAKGQSGKFELAVPGILYDPYQGAKKVLETPLGDERTYAREVGPAGLAAAGAAQPNFANRIPTIPKPMLSLRPETAAAARISRAAIEDLQPQQSTPINPITREELRSRGEHTIRRGEAAGQDVRIMDVAGESTKGEARRAADISSRAQANMGPFAEERWKLQSTRIAEWLRSRMGNPREAHLELQAIKEASKDPKNAAYVAAFNKEPNGLDLRGPSGIALAGLMQAKRMQAFAKDAEERFETARLAGNTVWDTPIQPFSVRGVFNPNKLPLEYWDYVKRSMDDAIGRAGSTEAKMLIDIRKQLVDELDKIVPEYKVARGIAAEAFQAGDAVEAGINIARNTRISPSQIAVIRNKAPATEWGRVQTGFFSEWMTTILRTGDRQDILRRIAANPIEREKIKAVLGRRVAEDLEGVLYIEDLMQKTYRALHGGSMSPRRFARMHTPSIAPSTAIAAAGYWWMGSWKGTLIGALLYGARRGEEAFHRAVVERVADKLISKDPNVYMDGIYEIRPYLPNLRRFMYERVLPQGPRTITSNPQIMEPGIEDRNAR